MIQYSMVENMMSREFSIPPVEIGEKKELERLTKFERTRMISSRMMQLTYGVEKNVDIETNDLKQIALAELKEKKIPFLIERRYANGYVEHVHLNNLI